MSQSSFCAALLIGMSASVLVPSAASAAPILVQSTFGTDAEGWTVNDLVNLQASSAPVFVAAGGNPGGFLRTADLYNFNAYIAPAAFLGNQSAAYGGNLHLEERVLSSTFSGVPMAVISDGLTTLQFRTNAPASGAAWTSFDIPLLAASGWELFADGNVAGAAASEVQLQTVLAGLNSLRLRADWRSGGTEQVDLDNVRLERADVSSVPEPSSVALVGAGLAGLLRARRRSRR
jgi:hypothetical protein